MMMMKAQPPVLVKRMHMLLLFTTMAALAVAVQAQNWGPTLRPTPAPTSAAQISLYVYGTDLLLNAWGGTDYITSGSPVKLVQNGGVAGSNEKWTFRSDGTITTPSTLSADGFLCLDSAHYDSTLPANQLTVFNCINNNVNQKWTWNSSTHIITNTGTGYCLDASINGIQPFQQLALASCNATILGQRFLPQVDTTLPIYVYGLLLTASSKTVYGLLLTASSKTSGSPVQLVQKVGAPASDEKWTFGRDGTITTTTSTGVLLCLDSAHYDSTLPANQLTVFNCINNNVNQKWTRDSSTGLIQNTGTGYCLDASINGIHPGAQLALASCNATRLAQRFFPY